MVRPALGETLRIAIILPIERSVIRPELLGI
jgi:hypothetical protein